MSWVGPFSKFNFYVRWARFILQKTHGNADTFVPMKFPFRWYIKLLFPHALTGGFLSIFYMVWLMNDSPVHGIKLLFVLSYLWIFFSLASFLVWSYFLAPRLGPYTLRWKILWALGSLLAGFWLVDNIPVILPGAGMPGHPDTNEGFLG